MTSKLSSAGCEPSNATWHEARAILLVADTRHNRQVINQVPDLRHSFPIGTRHCLAALGRGDDPAGDCLVIL